MHPWRGQVVDSRVMVKEGSAEYAAAQGLNNLINFTPELPLSISPFDAVSGKRTARSLPILRTSYGFTNSSANGTFLRFSNSESGIPHW